MTEQKLTPTQKLKLAEAEISKLKELIHKLQDEHVRELNTRLAEVQNQNYTLGYDEGFSDATKIAAAQKAEAGIQRFFKK
jgi:predicted nuclease with TOPRIM domain